VSPLVAFDLQSLLILDANEAAYDRLGVSPDALDGVALSHVLEPTHGDGAMAAMALLAAGDIDSFEATRYVRQPDRDTAVVHIWVRRVSMPRVEFGLATIEDTLGYARSVATARPETTAGNNELDDGLTLHYSKPELSARQREILALLIRGGTVREIAATTYLSTSTVRNHLSALYRKFGVHSQAGLLTKLFEDRA
jgi:DNA-binding CsgD family transcriptional regulator